jgi:hypothetical protein
VLFRLPVPESSSLATIRWREHSLGAIETPVIGVKEMVDAVTLDMPTLHASLAGHAVACRAVITGQAKNVLASAVIRSASLLAPLHDWRLRVQIAKDDAEIGVVYVPLTSAEMRQRQTLLTALLPKMRITGSYEISWHLASRCLATQRVRVVSKRVFLRSLRVSAARFHLEAASGARHCVRALPGRDGKLFLDGIRSITPVFYVSSSQAGVAGLAPFTLRALVDGVVTTLAIEKDVLVTDGLRAVALATVPAAKIGQIKHFSLATGDTTLGNLSLAPAPTADFTSEGGFAPLEDFLWSPAAEEQLHERLGKLLDDD